MQKIKKLFKRVLGLFPQKLPIGMTDFYLWADDVIELSGLPNNESVVFALATMVLHLPPTACYKSKEYFIRSLLKTASNQIAHGVMQELKDKQVAKAKAEQEAAAATVIAENNQSGAV